MLYFILVFVFAAFEYKSIKIGMLAIYAVGVQFYGYGTGFLKSFTAVKIFKKKPQEVFPELFFKID